MARQIPWHPNRPNEIVLGRRSITSDTALRLCSFLNRDRNGIPP